MSNKDLLKEVQGIVNNLFQKEVDELIAKTVNDMKKKAITGSREITCITHSKTKSDMVVKHFETQGFTCSVYYDGAEDYGDCDTYSITIRW